MLLSCPASPMFTGARTACAHAAGAPNMDSALPDRNAEIRSATRTAQRALGLGRARGMVPHAISGPECRQEILLFFRTLSEHLADQEERPRHTNYGGAPAGERHH